MLQLEKESMKKLSSKCEEKRQKLKDLRKIKTSYEKQSAEQKQKLEESRTKMVVSEA